MGCVLRVYRNTCVCDWELQCYETGRRWAHLHHIEIASEFPFNAAADNRPGWAVAREREKRRAARMQAGHFSSEEEENWLEVDVPDYSPELSRSVTMLVSPPREAPPDREPEPEPEPELLSREAELEPEPELELA